MDIKLLPSKRFEDPKKEYTSLKEKFDFDPLGLSAGGNIIYGKTIIKQVILDCPKILFLGGVHGNETEGVAFCLDFIEEFTKVTNPNLSYELYCVPIVNPDGFLSYKRQNQNQVDLNRNLPTKDWSSSYEQEKYYPGLSAGSESENKIIIDLISNLSPSLIISFHSWKPLVNINGPSKKFGQILSNQLKMELVEDIGYPTPGSLGEYAGRERSIPTITLEFSRGDDLGSIYSFSRNAILEACSLVLV